MGQSRHSKGVAGKVVHSLKLEAEKATLTVAFVSFLRMEVDLYFQSSKLTLIDWHFFCGFVMMAVLFWE